MPAKIKFSDSEIREIISLYTSTSASTRDIAHRFSVAYNTINAVLRNNGIKFRGNEKISQKLAGKESPRKGATHSAETRKKLSESAKGRKPTTLGKKYTSEERANISAGLSKSFSERPTRKMREARSIGVEKINKARSRCKNLLHRVLKITGNKKVTRTYVALGYTEKELIAHIEKQFKPGMSWSDRESFHIDHIKPVSAFVREGIFDPKIINALDNLQPLFPQENRKKSDSFNVNGNAEYTKGIA